MLKQQRKKKSTNKIQKFLHKLLIALKTIFAIVIVLKAILRAILS